MKHFTQREKNIIIGIQQGTNFDSYVLTNAFADLLYDKGVAFDSLKGFLQYDGSKYNISSILQVERDLIETALLIQYLIDNQYIYLIKDSKEPPLPWIGDPRSNPVGKAIPKDIADIINNSQVRIFAMSSLADLVEDDFKTYEEKQLLLAQEQLNVASGSLEEAKKQSSSAKRTLRWSIAACIIAILTLLASILVPSCSKYMAKAPLDTQIDSTNIATEFDITSINTRLDLINNNILQLVEFNANLNNDFKIQPNIQVSPRKKSNSKKTAKQAEKKCSLVQPILKIDTINCDGETYWVLPCPPKKTSTIEEPQK